MKKNAMLVRLSVSAWHNQVNDIRVRDEVAARHGLERQDTDDKYIKTLLPKYAMKSIAAAIHKLRLFHREHTLPWNDDSVRILPSRAFFNYQKHVQELIAEVENEVEKLAERLPRYIEEAKIRKKTLFDQSQYPTAERLRSRFRTSVSFLPFPDVYDFRVDLAEEDKEFLSAQAQELVADIMSKATDTLIDRIRQRLIKVVDALEDPKKIFRDMTIYSVIETADLVSELNIDNNEQVNTLCATVTEIMTYVTPEALRKQPAFRADLVKRIKAVLASISSEP